MAPQAHATLTADAQWLRDEDADQVSLLDQALGELAVGLDHHDGATGWEKSTALVLMPDPTKGNKRTKETIF
jgi:hypothetical protein